MRTEEELNQLKVDQLKQELKNLGLNSQGRKAELISRILDWERENLETGNADDGVEQEKNEENEKDTISKRKRSEEDIEKKDDIEVKRAKTDDGNSNVKQISPQPTTSEESNPQVKTEIIETKEESGFEEKSTDIPDAGKKISNNEDDQHPTVESSKQDNTNHDSEFEDEDDFQFFVRDATGTQNTDAEPLPDDAEGDGDENGEDGEDAEEADHDVLAAEEESKFKFSQGRLNKYPALPGKAGEVNHLNYISFIQDVGKRNTPFEVDLDAITDDEKPWNRYQASLDDFFNYGFNESTWRVYAARQVALRIHALESSKAIDDAAKL